MTPCRDPRRRLVLAPLLALIAGCGGATDGGPVPTTLLIRPATTFTFTAIGQTQQLQISVLDQQGNPVTDVTPEFSSSDPGVTSVSASGLIMAVGNGASTISVTAGPLSGSISVTVSQVPTQIQAIQGDGQLGTVGQALPLQLRVRVNDALGTRVAGAAVVFAVASGGGSLSATLVTADALGEAATTWTLGTNVSLAQQLSAASGSAPPAVFTAIASSGPAALINKVTGDNQSGTENLALPISPRVRVTDQFGNAKAGMTVVFAVASGGGTVTGGTQSTNGSGEAAVVSWTLGPGAGMQTLTATVPATALSTTFTATSQAAGAPAAIAALVGDNQISLRGFATNIRPAVRVTDAGGLPVSGLNVTFTPSAGGSVTGGTATTNANGIAQVGSWTPGSTAGSYTLSASVAPPSVSPAQFMATARNPEYSVAVRFEGPTPSPAAQAAFDSARVRWERIIYGSVGAQPLSIPADACGVPHEAVNEVVNGLLILARIDSIDGRSGVLGFAGTCVWRSSGMPVVGIMVFDSADVADPANDLGRFASVILHEMAHVIGFSISTWNRSPRSCLQLPSSPASPQDTHFNCVHVGATSLARAAFDSLGGTSYTMGNKVPLENCGPQTLALGVTCGSGNINSHWREPTFGNELMTGYYNAQQPNPLSVLSIATFGDAGYLVNYAAASPYSRTFAAPPAERGALISYGDDVFNGPQILVDQSGRILRVIPPPR